MDGRLLMNRQLSRKLVALWTSSHPEALSLLQRVLPAGLLGFLDSSETVPANADDELGEGVPNRDNLKVQLIVNVPFVPLGLFNRSDDYR